MHRMLQNAQQLLAQNNIDAARKLCEQVFATRHAVAKSAEMLGAMALRDKNPAAAERYFRQAEAIDPGAVEYPFALGELFLNTGHFTAALAAYDRALRIRADLAPIHNNRANTLKMLGRFDEAVASYTEAARLQPASPEVLTNLGVALAALGRLDEAAQSYDRALAVKPDHASARWNRSLLLLLRGDYANGWPEYEWRWHVPNYKPFFRDYRSPRWQGEDLLGRTILLHYEQGLGDTLQFARYVPLVQARGGRIILYCQPEVVRLLREDGRFGTVVPSDQPVPAHDVHCSLMSLPAVLRTTLDAIPGSEGYIRPDATAAARWRESLPQNELKVGLVWAGKLWNEIPAAKSIDARRSMNLGLLAPLLEVPGVRFYSLQMGDPVRQLREAGLPHVRDMSPHISDFADTAAICAALDLVISVDTSVVHLAGALNVPTWVFSRHDGCWRWLLEREDTPWYRTMRLFRQHHAGDWTEVIARVAEALRHLTTRR